MAIDDQTLLRFLAEQSRDYGGNVEIEAGLWAVFAVPANDADANAIAQSLLGGSTLTHEAGLSADDRWMIYYVNDANRHHAAWWLDDVRQLTAGEIRPVPLAQRSLAREIATSDKPHRLAQQLADRHARGEIAAGFIRERERVRALLDRLHRHEPLFFAALLQLLTRHLIDWIVLSQQLIPEDVAALNDVVRGGMSRDPFLQTRQDAAAGIRNALLEFHLINPMDQQKNTAIANPYAVYMDVVVTGGDVHAPIDGTAVAMPRASYLRAIHATRRNLYRGEAFGDFDTQAPWMNAEIAHPFRFIRQRVASHRELTPLDALYMLERAAAD